MALGYFRKASSDEIEKAVLAERERCAKVAEGHATQAAQAIGVCHPGQMRDMQCESDAGYKIAAKIRSGD